MDFGKGGGKGDFGKGPGKAGGDGSSSSGVVKSYNAAKGFGFIQSAVFPGDIYFKFGDNPINQGTPVTYTLRVMPDGKAQASDVVPGLSEGDHAIGTIKKIHAEKGFGFLEVPGQPGDVYFKLDALPRDLLEEGLQGSDESSLVGKQVRFTVHLTPD